MDLTVSVALITAASGLGGALAGGWLTTRSAALERRERRRELLRDAYAHWLDAFEAKCLAETQHIDFIHTDSNETSDPEFDGSIPTDEMLRVAIRERIAFYLLSLKEPKRELVDRVDALRKRDPFGAYVIAGMNKETFYEVATQQHTDLRGILQDVGGTVALRDL